MQTNTGELMVCSGPTVGQTHPIDGQAISMGRSASCDVPLDDERASSVHARVLYERGQHRLVDLDSTNGTFVNNQRVQDILLRPGDLIQIGETIFEYRRNDAPEVVEPVAHGYGSAAGQHLAHPGVPRERALALPRAEDYYAPHGPYGQLPPGTMPPPAEERLDLAALWGWAKPILAAFVPFWWVFILAALLGAVAGLLDYRLRPPAKKAVFEVNLIPKASESVTGQYARTNLEFFREAEQNFTSGRLIEETYRKMGLEQVSPALIDVTQNVLLSFDKVGGYQSNLYAGSYKNQDAEFAVEFLRTHVENYLDTEIEKALKIVLAEQDFFRRELGGAEERLEQAEQALLDYKARNVDAVPSEEGGAYADLVQFRSRLRSLESRIADETLQLQYERQKLNRVSKFTVLEKTDNNPYQERIAALEAQLAEERAAGKGPRHPDVIKVQQNLEEVKALARGASGNTQSAVRSSKNPIYAAAEARVYELESSLAVAKQERERLKAQIAEAEQKAAQLPEQVSRLEDLQEEYEEAKEEYDRISTKLRQSQQQVELERASAEARHDLITPPQLEYVDHRERMRMHALKAMILIGAITFLAVLGYLIYRRRLTLEMLKLPKKRVGTVPTY
jgi:uncharacterized protein involved in exopolysaccharide biosynthesis